MKSLSHFVLILLTTCLLQVSYDATAKDKQYRSVEWPELMPKDDLETLLNPPDSIYEIQDGSKQDNLDAAEKIEDKDEAMEKYFAALKSLKVVKEFHNQAVKIPGFIVPLEADENNLVTEFFIVPYFGACLHLPPPPPNQIIYAQVTKGFELESLHYPFWFEGDLLVSTNEHALGSSAYQLKIDELYPYEE